MYDSEKSNFVLTLALLTTPRDESILAKRFKAARSAYNALLGECLRRSGLMRESKAWRTAGKMSKGKAKTTTYRALNEQYRFREYDLYTFIQTMRAGVRFYPAETSEQVKVRTKGRKGFIGEHLDAHTVMAMAKRAFAAVERAIFECSDVHLARHDTFRSVQGINDKSSINWTGSAAVWSGLTLHAIIDLADPVVKHGVESRVKLTRIVRMMIRGKLRYFVQLVCEGQSYKKVKHEPVVGIVGLDIGPSTIAVVSEQSATLNKFCDELEAKDQKIRQLQRQSDRQVRANNPDCFDEKGRWIKGKRISIRTKRMRKVRQLKADIQRRQQSHRKQLHGEMVHDVLAQGNDVRTEKLSYVSLQKNFGKSVGFRAPGMFVAKLKATAEKYGATFTEFATVTTRLSQTCPGCGAIKKKQLSERWHHCEKCGASVQRDISSAYLARFVVGDRLDIAFAVKHWPGVCNLLLAVSGNNNGLTNGALACVHPLPIVGRDPSHENVSRKSVSMSDVVAPSNGIARADGKPVEGIQYTCKNQMDLC